MLRTVHATRYVMALREGGSLPGLVEADDDGLYVAKFRAAGQGLKALVAEIIIGELARGLGLAVPEIVLVDVPAPLGRAEPDPEINELVSASTGINVGLDFLPGAIDLSGAPDDAIPDELASRIVWFDAYATNVDRSARNPNLLIWHGRPWLIDHGAALYQHHLGVELASRAQDPFALVADHVLLPRASALEAVDAAMAAALTPELIAAAVDAVPGTLLGPDATPGRRAYRDYLAARAHGPRAFLEEAVSARGR